MQYTAVHNKRGKPVPRHLQNCLRVLHANFDVYCHIKGWTRQLSYGDLLFPQNEKKNLKSQIDLSCQYSSKLASDTQDILYYVIWGQLTKSYQNL